MIERTLVLIKPDGVQRALVGEILSRFERVGLKIIGLKMVSATEDLAGKHYADDEAWLVSVGDKALSSAQKRGIQESRTAKQIGQDVRKMLMSFISMSPVVAIVLEGHSAAQVVRKLVGDTNPLTSAPGTIRGDYTIDSYALSDHSNRPIQNLIHASGNAEEGKREVALWFKEEELHFWKRIDEDLIYRKGK